MSDFAKLPDDAYLRQAQIIPTILPVSAATLWRYVSKGNFPKPHKLGPNCTAWKVADIRAWMKSKAA